MAIAGEPLSGQHGVLLYSVQNAKGTAVTPATAVGICSDVTVSSNSGLRPLFGVGSEQFVVAKAGIVDVPISIPNVVLQSSAFLVNCCQRVNGALPWITVGVGYKDDAGAMWGWQIQDCKVGNYDVSWDAGGADASPLTASFTLMSLGRITELTSMSPANLSTLPWDQFEGVLLKGGAAWEAASFRLTVNHNVRKVSVIPGAAPASGKREAKYLPEGRLDVTGELTRHAKSAINLQADTVASFNLSLVGTSLTPANTVSFAITTAFFTEEEFRLGDEILFRTLFLAKTLAIT